MGDWQEVKPKPWSPCDGCQMGYGGVSQKVENGKLYQKVDDCYETCQRYSDWVRGDIVGDIIRERKDALMELAKR